GVSASPFTADPAAGPGVTPESVRHPDANLISAFVERTMRERERVRIMKHLEQCRHCRQLVMLATPRVNFDATAVSTSRSSAYGFRPKTLLSSRALRWGTLAALGVVVASVILYRSPDRAVRQGQGTTEDGMLPSGEVLTSSDNMIAENSEGTPPVR